MSLVRPPSAGLALLLLLLLAPLPGRAAGPPGEGPPTPPPATAVSAVKVTWKERPLPGVSVGWYRSLPPGEAAASAVTDGEGRAAAGLPPGRYFLVARLPAAPGGSAALPVPGDRYGYYGGNPVVLAAGGRSETVLPLSAIVAPPAPPAGGAPVYGTVTVDGAPLRGAVVSAHASPDGSFREPPYAVSSPTEEDGSFSLELPPGRWFLVARKRASGSAAGPLRPGDAFGYFPGNPLDVAEGVPAAVSIPAALRRKGGEGSAASAAPATVEGRVTGRDGRPRRGVVAYLHERQDRFGRPRYLSEPTGPDGRFRIPVREGGRYWPGARSGYGGAPAPGELQGGYARGDGSIVVGDGDRLTGIDIVVDEVP